MATSAPFSERSEAKKHPQEQALSNANPVWHVVVLNDPVNLMAYVVMVFQRVFGYDKAKSEKHMLEVHQNGQSVLWSGPRERAEHFAYQLQYWQLSALLIRDA